MDSTHDRTSCLQQAFLAVEQTGEPATIFISPELGDLEETIDQIKKKGLRMAPVPPGCISVFPPIPIGDDELYLFCKEYCLGSTTTRAHLRRELYFKRDSCPKQSNDSNVLLYHPYDCVVRIAELCLLLCNASSNVSAHLYATSPYLQVSPVKEICTSIVTTFSTFENVLNKDEICSSEGVSSEQNDTSNEVQVPTATKYSSPHGHVHAEPYQDLTGVEQVDENVNVVYLEEKDYEIVTKSGVFYDSQRVAAVYITKGISKNICVTAASCLEKAATKNNLRSLTNGGEPPETGIVGYYDYLNNPTSKKCRETQYMRKHWSSIAKGCSDFLLALDALYAKHAPSHYKLQGQVIPHSYQLLGTVFSTITVNRNFRTAPHTDKGDFKSGLAALCVLKGRFEGCHLAMPALGKAFQLKPGDVLFFDASLMHGNTEVKTTNDTWERISVVCYLRNGLMSAICEAERRKNMHLLLEQENLMHSSRHKVINLNDGQDDLPRIFVPMEVAVKLATAQVSALSFIADRVVKGSGCIISMAMGLGKTLVALVSCFSSLYSNPNRDILVVAPKSCISNWVFEMTKWAPMGLSFQNCIYADGCVSSGFENKIIDFIYKRKIGQCPQGHLILLNPEMVASFLNRFSEFRPALLIVDEGHCLGSKASRLMENLNKFECPQRIVLSGTPLQNDASELYRLVKWVYNDIETVLPRSAFNEMENSITQYINGNDSFLESATKSQAYINDWMKAFVFREIDVDLPPLLDYLLICGSSDMQTTISEDLMSTKRNASNGNRANEHRPAHLAAHPLNFYELVELSASSKRCREVETPLSPALPFASTSCLVDDSQDNKCSGNEEDPREEATKKEGERNPPEPNCFLQFNDNDTKRNADIFIHQSMTSSDGAEPFAEAGIPDFLNRILEEKKVIAFASYSGKMATVLRLAEYVSKRNEKAILFSQYCGPQETLLRTLEGAGFMTLTMRGRDSHERRKVTASTFSKHSGSCFLILSTRIAAFGHDFTAANHVILFDSWWNPQADSQAIARAYRRNQDKPVTVYRLASEIEDQHVIKIQLRKLALFKSIIHDRISRSCRDQLSDYTASEEDSSLRELWHDLKRTKLSGNNSFALQSVLKFSEAIKDGSNI